MIILALIITIVSFILIFNFWNEDRKTSYVFIISTIFLVFVDLGLLFFKYLY